MPLTHFLGIVALVILSAGLTLVLVFWSGVPLAAVAFATLSASLIFGWSRVGR